MSDEKPPGEPFRWGLRPGGGDEGDETTPLEPAVPPTPEPVDQGYFTALEPDQPALPGAAQQHDDQATQAFDFRAPAPYVPPVYDPTSYTPPVDIPPAHIPPFDATSAYPHFDPAAGSFPAMDASLDGATEALVAQPVGLGLPEGESAPTSAIDALFGEASFQEYDSSITASPSPFARQEIATIGGGGMPPTGGRPERQPLARGQKALLWVAGVLAAAIALVGLFLLGTKLGPILSPEPVATPTPTPSASAPAFVEILGPVTPGVYPWDELLGTECLEPFVSAWEQEFTVTDCATAHTAQLVYRGTFDDSQLAAYPGVEALQARMNLLCTSSANINYQVASQFGDIQYSASFAADEQEWIDGHRDYFCFVSRSSGEPFTASVAMPDRPAPVIPVVPEPEP